MAFDFSAFPILITDRIILRELRKEDAADLLVFRGDAEEQLFNSEPLQTLEQSLALINEVRGDSAYGNSTLARACRRAGARFSLVLVKNSTVTKAIAAIPEEAWTPVHYPGAVTDPDTGELISDAEVAEVPVFTAFASTPHPVTARLIVRRVRDRARLGELF
jgi:hypothetical protein